MNQRERAIDLKSQEMTYAQIGRFMGITRQYAQQLCKPPKQVYILLSRRSGGRCEKCGKPLNSGHVHHIKYTHDRWNLDDLLYLCQICHRREHKGEKIIGTVTICLNAVELQRLNRLREYLGGVTASGALKFALKAAYEQQRALQSSGRLPSVTHYAATRHFDTIADAQDFDRAQIGKLVPK